MWGVKKMPGMEEHNEKRVEQRSSNLTNRRKVVFDIDDTIWAYTYRIAQMVGVDYTDWIDFHTLNPRLTEAQKGAITQAYHSLEPYRNMIFYDGIEEILQLEKYGALVQFKSHSFARSLLDLKEQNLKAVLPQLRPEQLILEQDVAVDFMPGRAPSPRGKSAGVRFPDSPPCVKLYEIQC